MDFPSVFFSSMQLYRVGFHQLGKGTNIWPVSILLTLIYYCFMNKRLENKIALITGAARGIGAAIARKFHQEGAVVIVTDILDTKGKVLVAELGERAYYFHLNVKYEHEWKDMSKIIITEFGGLDVLVNNAGITGFLETNGPHDAEMVDLDSWTEVMAVNLNGSMLGCKYAIDWMKRKGGGSIINISSRSGIVGIPGAAAYAASKAAVRNHTKSVALHCAEKGYHIRCNSIHPAAIMTPMWDVMLGEGEVRDLIIASVEKGIPMGHFGQPEDVAYAALYLASVESKYVTGIELNVDGGILAGAEAKPEPMGE
ncbi:NAD(P)-dependent dehydrogenase (short-subunit alcohol dehydrogenase family) [Cecembia calidifontis]|jgi:NAD(P)-dependent dehydrogenase (short-subunit alcohol dehydrogenase family)|uniref:NAD(P)-dependent dehydrogenase (Short-subunit alcohol dehydrogenase family) n=2 Tax=Cecembia calidifontis TaxID=1187080 RepID=A0A4Q7PBY5_9BACT|nr:NAD(P)-dependent dehydrogenase (short-subunit alcohol dehydrogenase family) [Cecembia calidifontis]